MILSNLFSVFDVCDFFALPYFIKFFHPSHYPRFEDVSGIAVDVELPQTPEDDSQKC